MNISIQICGLFILSLILIFFIQQKKLRLKTTNAFFLILIVAIVSLCLDILSIVALNTPALPDTFIKAVCKLYLTSLIGVGYSGINYVYVDIYSTRHKWYKTLKYSYLSLFILGGLTIFILPINYICDPDKSLCYTFGPSVIATYVMAVFFILSIMSIAFLQRQNMNQLRNEAVEIWMTLWICAAAIQFVNENFLIVGYASAIGVSIIYILLENPQTNIDRQTGLFNQGALIQYIRQLYEEKDTFSAIWFIIDNSFQRHVDNSSSHSIDIEISSFLSESTDGIVFKNSEDEYILIFKNDTTALSHLELIEKRMKQGWGKDRQIFVPYNYIYISRSDIVDNYSQLLHLTRFARINHNDYVEGNHIIITENIVNDMNTFISTEAFIRDAISDDRIEIFYQPIYSTKDSAFTAAEALVRIRDKEGNIIPPGRFIDVAVKNGSILHLGEIVFEKVCSFIENNDMKKMGLHYVEINLSVVQCAYENLADTFISIMEKHNIEPGYINLDITESASTNAKRTLLNNMKTLINYGVNFSLDDFGTGQSNLNYIINMPVVIVKFDRQMSMAYFENGKAKYVMDAAMHMIHGLKLQIVSEGIETEEQYREMVRLGINYIQGFYFSKPLPEQEFIHFLKTH